MGTEIEPSDDDKVVRDALGNLAELLAGVTPDNLHAEQDWSIPQGKEVW